MKHLEDLKKDISLINTVDWNLNPAVAVGRHLEWGAGWFQDDQQRGLASDEVSTYFAINTWGDYPVIVLIQRRGFDMEEIASFRMPAAMEKAFMESIGHHRGVYELDPNIKMWLKGQLNVQ